MSKFVGGAISDLEVGKTITVNGKENQDGSVTAQTIQLRPQGRDGVNQIKSDQVPQKNSQPEKNNERSR